MKTSSTKNGYGTEKAEEMNNYSEKEREAFFPERMFENTSIWILVDEASFSEKEYAMFEESLDNYLSDKGSKEVLRLINGLKEGMVVSFDENCKYNSIQGFDGSPAYAAYHKTLSLLYGHLWLSFAAEEADYAEISAEDKVGIMDYVGSKLI